MFLNRNYRHLFLFFCLAFNTACLDQAMQAGPLGLETENNESAEPTPTPAPTPVPTPTPTPVPTPTPTPNPGNGKTYFIRPNGGDYSQCNGLANADYPGVGTNQNCAWKHPFFALPPNSPAKIAGGDTVIIASGEYRMGLGAPNAVGCHSSYPWDCKAARIPGGPSESQPTRILGDCTSIPKLWGTERAGHILNLRGSSNVEIACLEITDKASCIDNHCHGGDCSGVIARCSRDSYPYGDWAGSGIVAEDSNNVKLTKLNIHGLANAGIKAGRISNWYMNEVKIIGNGWVGWDGDIGEHTSSNSGIISFKNSEISWNGCVENHINGTHTGCWGQQTGGYGDGLGTGRTQGHWIFENTKVTHNTSDGIDLLYMDGGSVTVKNSYFEGNAGNQLKTKTGGSIENNIIIGNCSYFDGKPQHNLVGGDHCRAAGNTLSLGFLPGHAINIKHNTITGEGDCLILSGGGDSSSQLNVFNNILHGQTDWRQPWEFTCLAYRDGGSHGSTYVGNIIYNTKNNDCPNANLCQNPELSNMSVQNYNPVPLNGSPVIDAANMSHTLAVDYNYSPRNRGLASDIGAIEK